MDMTLRRAMTRRGFLRLSGGATAGLGLAGLPPRFAGGVPGGSGVVDPLDFAPTRAREDPIWHPLRRMSAISPDALTLVAAEGQAAIGGGGTSPAWMLNQSLPSPMLRARQGDRFRVTLDNQLEKDELILHWHGITPPEASDGHPRLQIPRGERYEYDFTVENRAGTYWYHSHAHMRVGKHSALGIGGMFLVEDDEERALDLPSGGTRFRSSSRTGAWTRTDTSSTSIRCSPGARPEESLSATGSTGRIWTWIVPCTHSGS